MSTETSKRTTGNKKRPAYNTPAGRKAAAQRKDARRRNRRKHRIRNTAILISVLLVLVAGTGFVVWKLRDGIFAPIARPYEVAKEFDSTVADADGQRADAFSKELCVSEANVDLEGISLESYQTGTLMDLSQKKVLYAQNIYSKIYPASITKIMTAIVALENGNLQDMVTITDENLNLEAGSQVCGLMSGDQLTLEQLLHCLLVYSGNDAAAAIATHVGGTEAQFVEMMNQEAVRLGMTGTHFTNPHGLHDENHYTTVYDIYLMLQEGFKYSKFTEITQLSSYTMTYEHWDGSEAVLSLDSTDYYLNGQAATPKDVTILGGKTGTTDQAGNCLALITQNAYGSPYISIVLNAYDKPTLYSQMGSLLQKINEV